MIEQTTRRSFCKGNKCIVMGLTCEMGRDCRSCLVPVSVGLVQLTKAINNLVPNGVNYTKENKEAENNGNGTESDKQ